MLPRCLGHHLSLYNLSVLFSTNRKSLKTSGRAGNDVSPPTGSQRRTDGIGQIQDGAVISDGWDFSLPLFLKREPVHLDGLPASIARERSIPQKNTVILVLLLPLVFLLKHKCPCAPITEAALWFALQDFHYFPSLSSSGYSWCCWIAYCSTIIREGIVMEVGCAALESILTPFNSLPVLTPQLSAMSLHDEPWHHRI